MRLFDRQSAMIGLKGSRRMKRSARYLPLRHYAHDFPPSVRLVSKQRQGAKVTKRYAVGPTPY
jgi:hypothetical protein